MPEGPEVKIMSDYLNAFFLNNQIVKIECLSEYFEKKYQDVLINLEKYLIGKKIMSFTIGKNTFIKLNKKLYYRYHLGMTGSWINSYKKHCHLKISTYNSTLYFVDVRKFGKHNIINQQDIKELYKSEFDMLNKNYNYILHLKHLKSKIKSNKNICTVLMDQQKFPGIGNYIKSEVLFASKIHPDTNWGQLKHKEIQNILLNAEKIIKKSYVNGGAELKDFKNPLYNSMFELYVYGKENDPYGNEVSKKKTKDQRRTWWSPAVQKLKV